VFYVRIGNEPALNLSQTDAADEDTPVFSPDGSQVAFASNRSGDWDLYLVAPDGTNVRAAVTNGSSDELHPSFTPDGQGLVFSSNREAGNWDIYTATIGSDGTWRRLTSHPSADRFPTVSPDGNAITFRSERDGDSEIYVMTGDGSDLRQITSNAAFDSYPTFTPDGSGVVFASDRAGKDGVYLVNVAGEGLIELEKDPAWRAFNPRVSADGRHFLHAGGPLDGQVDIYRREFTSPLLAIGKRGAASLSGECNWEEGVLALGWIHAWQETGDPQYGQWVREWVDACIAVKTHVSHVNDGLLGYAALTAYESSGQLEYRTFADQVAGYLMEIAPRTSDGTLTHDSQRVWVDTLLGTVPFLTKMSQISGNDVYIEEAITQTIKHAEYLQDPDSGLYYHAWDETQCNPAGHIVWGRGNGWALLADVVVLSTTPDSHPSHATILANMRNQAAGLRALQDSSGLWRTVLTRSDSYLETSASSLIGYSLEYGVQQGWLDSDAFSAPAESARLGVWRHTLANGTVTDVSAATWPMMSEEDYNARPHEELQLYGQGVALLLQSPYWENHTVHGRPASE
jgi:unsaturated rhamnogalacturonyl hydrolase